MKHSDAPYVPFYGLGNQFIGIWVRDPDHPNLNARLQMFAVGESLPVEVYAALSSGRYRRIENDRTDIGNGVVFAGGAFLMLGDAKAPNEARQKASSSPTSSAHTKWFRNSEIRGRPKSPSDFIVTGDGAIPYSPISEWFPEVSRDPWTTRMGIVPIRDIGASLPSLSGRLQEDHGVSDEDLQSLFDIYVGIVCIDCLAGITIDLLRTVSAYSKLRRAVFSDARIVRLLEGKCHNCDFDHYGIIWFGESKD